MTRPLLLLSLLLVVGGPRPPDPDPTASIPRLPWVANRLAGDIGWRARGDQAVHGNGNGGELVCHNGKPHIEPQDTNDLVGLGRDENRLHESMHAEQFAPNCDSIMALWTAEPFYRLELEAIATCYGLEVYVSDSVYSYRKWKAVARISTAYGSGFDFNDIRAALDRHCPRGERGGA